MSSLLREFGIDETLLTEEEVSYYEQIATFAKASQKTNKNSILNDQRINSTTVRSY